MTVGEGPLCMQCGRGAGIRVEGEARVDVRIRTDGGGCVGEFDVGCVTEIAVRVCHCAGCGSEMPIRSAAGFRVVGQRLVWEVAKD